MDEVYTREHREDMIVTLRRVRPGDAAREFERMPGVELAEVQCVVPVRIIAGSRWRDTAITGLPTAPVLRHLFDRGGRPVEVPERGLLVSAELARRLAIRRRRPRRRRDLRGRLAHARSVEVGGLINEPFGIAVYARADWLTRLLGEEPRASTVPIAVDPDHRDEVRAQLKQMPEILGVTSSERVILTYREQTGRPARRWSAHSGGSAASGSEPIRPVIGSAHRSSGSSRPGRSAMSYDEPRAPVIVLSAHGRRATR